MTARDLYDGDSEDTGEALVASVCNALCEHVHPDLISQQVGDEFEQSTSFSYSLHEANGRGAPGKDND